MKYLIYILCCFSALVFAGCVGNDIVSADEKGDVGNQIVLALSSKSAFASRSVAMGAEVEVSFADVFVFDTEGEQRWYERTKPDSGERIVLNAKREMFHAGDKYWVYVVANCSKPSDELKELNLAKLKTLTQEDCRVHLTGVANVADAPRYFLMNGVAYRDGTAEPASPNMVVLNDATTDTVLRVVLRRLAAKIVVNIRQGTDVVFDDKNTSPLAGYYLINLPYSTSLIAGVGAEAHLRTTDRFAGDYFAQGNSGFVVTAYAYAHEWTNESALDKEVRLVVNLPMTYTLPNGGGETKHLGNNYYQIPVSKDKMLAANTCYRVNVTVNTPGAENPSQPVVLDDASYEVMPWNETNIDIGGQNERPVYLTVNKSEMQMHNTAEDNTTLTFASSSAVGVRMLGVYYIDKFGQRRSLSASEIRNLGISVVPTAEMSGNIAVYSPVPLNNTIRYIEFEINNSDGATPRKVTVEQYPLEYITNIQGWYSYRDDFSGNTYEAHGNPLYCSASSYNVNTDVWTYSNSMSNQFFTSKVATQKADGTSTLQYYSWSTSGNGANVRYTLNTTAGNLGSLRNARMYHVHITASSAAYTVGNPRLNNKGITDSGADNNKLVSPSFMIASQLGAVVSPQNAAMAASHCKHYVEVYKKPNGEKVVLDDWRLPTRAEVEIIMKYQYAENAAMDEVLAGRNYYCADGGTVTNTHVQASNYNYIRCIRDAYTKGN